MPPNSLQFGPNALLSAISRQPPPVAVVNPQPAMIGGFPASPMQAQVLGGGTATGQTPVTPLSAPGGFQPNPAADFLIGRANRPGDINTGVGLLGRLAALGVGQKLQRENERGEREETVNQLVALGMQPEIAALVAKGVISPPDFGKPAERDTFKDAKGRTRYLDTGELVAGEVGEGVPLDVKSPERQAQDVESRAAGKSSVTTTVKNLTGPAGAIQSANAGLAAGELTEDERNSIVESASMSEKEKATTALEAKSELIRAEVRPIIEESKAQLLAAADKLATNPLDQEAKAEYESAMNTYAIAKSKFNLPTEAVMADDKQVIFDTFPGPKEIWTAAKFGQNAVKAILDADDTGGGGEILNFEDL